MQNKKIWVAIAPLFLVLFIDAMGLGLLFPLLNSIIIDKSSAFLPLTLSLNTREFLYGLTVGIYMLSWFFGAAILGELSDKMGRKKSLLICLIGAFMGYFLSALSIGWHSLAILIIGRIVAGFTAGSQPIAQAVIVDVSVPEEKARNIGFILLASSLGFVFGPIVGGVLSDSKLVSWFNFSTPLYFAAILSFINAFLLYYLFEETYPITGKIKIKLNVAIEIVQSAFKHKAVCKLSLIFLVMIYGWANFFSFISMYASEKFQFTPLMTSLMLGDLGVGFSLGCGYLVNYFNKRGSINTIISYSFLLSALFMLMVLIPSPIFLWLMMIPVGAGIAVGYSMIISLFSDLVSEKEQGWVMGVTGSIMALCFGLTGLITGYLSHFGVTIPIWLAVLGVAVSGVMMLIEDIAHKKN